MNAFYEQPKSSIEFGYRCFDRIPLNGLIQPFQQPERVLGCAAGQKWLAAFTPVFSSQERRQAVVSTGSSSLRSSFATT